MNVDWMCVFLIWWNRFESAPNIAKQLRCIFIEHLTILSLCLSLSIRCPIDSVTTHRTHHIYAQFRIFLWDR